MIKILILSIAFIISASVFTQPIVSEKHILTLDTDCTIDPSTAKFDLPSGAYALRVYNHASLDYFYITRGGRSDYFNNFNNKFSFIFDNAGNSYSAASTIGDDKVSIFYLMKNSDGIAKLNLVYDDFTVMDDVLYIHIKNPENLERLLHVDLTTGEIFQSREYSSITLPQDYYTGKNIIFPQGSTPVFIAQKGPVNLLVYAGDEKVFDGYTLKPWLFKDKNGADVFIASRGEGKDFIMQGEKNFPVTGNIQPPVLFDMNNNPVYVSESIGSDGKKYARLYSGAEPSAKPYPVIKYLQQTPSGSVAYVGYKQNGQSSKVDSAFIIVNSAVKYSFADITQLSFTPDDVPVYSASKDGIKWDVYIGNKKIDSGYTDVKDLKVLPNGKLYYAGFSNIATFIVNVNRTKFGPINGYTVLKEMDIEDYFQCDASGNYAFISADKDGSSLSNHVYTNNKLLNMDLFNAKFMRLTGSNVITAGRSGAAKNSKAVVYLNESAVGNSYDEIMDIKFDEASKTLSFMGLKANELISVTMSF